MHAPINIRCLWYLIISKILSRQFYVSFKFDKNSLTGTSHEDPCPYSVTSHSFLLRMRNAADNFPQQNKTHFMFNNFFLENPVVYDIIWKNIVQSDRPQTAVWRLRIPYWISKATNTQSRNVSCLSVAPHCYVISALPVSLKLNNAVIVNADGFPFITE